MEGSGGMGSSTSKHGNYESADKAHKLIIHPEHTCGTLLDIRNKARQFVNEQMSRNNTTISGSTHSSTSRSDSEEPAKIFASARSRIPIISASTAAEVERKVVMLQQPRNVLHRKIQFVSQGLTNKHALLIAGALHGNMLLQELNLNGNWINADGLCAIAEAVPFTKIVCLFVGGNFPDDRVAVAMADAVVRTPSLTELNLTGKHDYTPSSKWTEAGVRVQGRGLKISTSLPVMTTAPKVGLHAMPCIQAFGGAAIARVLSNSSYLLTLKLDRQAIGDEGAAAFAEALSTNRTLTALGLSANGIGDTGARALALVLHNPKDSPKMIPGTKKGGASRHYRIAVPKTTYSNSTLCELDLTENQIGDAGGWALGTAVSRRYQKLRLYIFKNRNLREEMALTLHDRLEQEFNKRRANERWQRQNDQMQDRQRRKLADEARKAAAKRRSLKRMERELQFRCKRDRQKAAIARQMVQDIAGSLHLNSLNGVPEEAVQEKLRKQHPELLTLTPTEQLHRLLVGVNTFIDNYDTSLDIGKDKEELQQAWDPLVAAWKQAGRIFEEHGVEGDLLLEMEMDMDYLPATTERCTLGVALDRTGEKIRTFFGRGEAI